MLAGLGHDYVPGRPYKELCPHFVLKLSNLHADGRLGNVDSQSSRGKRARFSYRYKSLQLSDFQGLTPDIKIGYRNNKIF